VMCVSSPISLWFFLDSDCCISSIWILSCRRR